MHRGIPGIRVVTEELPWCHSAAVGVWIASGSSSEGPGEHGAAHFLEHVLFKRTHARTGREIGEIADALGAELNAYTGREHTCYHVQVPAEGLDAAVDLLTDIVAGGVIDDADVELERAVILDEFAARADDPEDLVCDLLTEVVLGDDPLGRPVIGDETSIRELTAQTLRGVHLRSLRPGDVVVAAAGRLDHDALVELVATGPLPAAVAAEQPARTPLRADHSGLWSALPRVAGEDEDTEQTQIALGRRSPGRGAPERAEAQIACAVLGGGLSSRLFQGVREDRGLAYSVYSAIDQFAATGVLTVVAGCADERADVLLRAVGDTVAGMHGSPPDQAEIDRAVGYLTGAIRLGLDDPMSRMTRIGRHLLDRDDVVAVETSTARLRAVTRSSLLEYWDGEVAPWSLALVGPGEPALSAAAADDVLGGLSGAAGR